MILWIITVAIGLTIILVGLAIHIKRNKKEDKSIDDEIGIEHIIPWISN